MMNRNNIEDLIHELENNHGIMTRTLGQIIKYFPEYTNCSGSQVDKMLEELSEEGVVYTLNGPNNRKNTVVRLYLRDRAVAYIIDASSKVDYSSDQILRRAAIFYDAYDEARKSSKGQIR